MTVEQLIDVLSELSCSCKTIKTNEDYRILLDKYNLMFLGKNFNKIYASDLQPVLCEKFNISVSVEELNALLPLACSILNMKCEPLFARNRDKNSAPCSYQITLW